MHFEILIEDKSGKIMLDILMPKILGAGHTFRIHAYKGIGRLPKTLASASDAKKEALLNDLPRILAAYGKTFAGYGNGYSACVVVVCDLDNRCLSKFRKELLEILQKCRLAPKTQYCIAVEEGEAWLLGDIEAVKAAYPNAKVNVLASYINDSICGTWELLKNAIADKEANKTQWAEKITPYVDIQRNKSPSFQYFVSKIIALIS